MLPCTYSGVIAHVGVDTISASATAPDGTNPQATAYKTWIDQFAKVSGNAGPVVVGSLAINYRVLGTVCTCTFTEGISKFTIDKESSATLADWANGCNVKGGTATIWLTDNTAAAPRGSIQVDASDDMYDIPLSKLDTGNVLVDELSTP